MLDQDPAIAGRNTKIDPVTLEIYWRRLNATVTETAATLKRTSFSSVIRDINDYACSLFDAETRLLAQSPDSTPGLCGPLGDMLRNLLEIYPTESLAPGDVLVCNDPWWGPGHHNDISIVAPAFDNGRIVGYAGCCAHQVDIGGRRATTESRDNYEEGLRIPPLKLFKAGEPNEDVFAFIRANVRSPDTVIGDVRAQLAAVHVGCDRLAAMSAELGWSSVQLLADEIIERSEALCRAEIGKIPNGTYRYETVADLVDGNEALFVATVTVEDDAITVDTTGSSPQVVPAVNCTHSFTKAYTLFTLNCILALPIPMNEGTIKPLTVITEPGSVFGAQFPAPVFGRTSTGCYVPEMIFQALAEVVPERVIAGSGATPLWGQYLYGNKRAGGVFAPFNVINGGLGARAGQDGVDCLPFPCNTGNTPAEVLESDSPVLVKRRAYWPDSAGPGHRRGGFGQEFDLQILDGDDGPQGTVLASLRGGRFKNAVPGVAGGGGAPKGILSVNGKVQDAGRQQLLQGSDIIRCRIPGGGGYGDPKKRDRALVTFEVAEGLITEDHAREFYGWEPPDSGGGEA